MLIELNSPFVSYDSINHAGRRLLNLLSLDDFQSDFAAGVVPVRIPKTLIPQ